MVATLLDELPARTIGYPVSQSYNIIFHLIVPSAVGLILYLILIAADITLAIQHANDGNPRWAASTLLLMYSPAACCFIFTTSIPNLWPSENPFSKENLKFLITQIWEFLAFPIPVLIRYGTLLFWSLEAFYANLYGNYERQEEALRIVMHPSSMELYIFLQAYLHSAPQIILQMYILLQENVPKETVNIQLLSIVCLLMRMAATTARYQRFERRKVLGTCYPWSMKQIEKITNHYSTSSNFSKTNSNISNQQSTTSENSIQNGKIPRNDERKISDGDDEVFERPLSCEEGRIEVDRGIMINETTVETYEPRVRFVEKVQNLSETGSEGEYFLEPIKKIDPEIIPGHYIEVIEDPSVEFRRKLKEESRHKYKIEDLSRHVTPPETPAPRPSSFAIFRDKIMSNADFLVDKIPRRVYKSHDDIDLPVRVRRSAIKGIEQEDGIARLVCIISWLLFVTARLVALSIFLNFHPAEGAFICLCHYIVATAALMWNSWLENSTRKFFYLFLGYVYLFCLIEFKMQFKKVRIWYGLFFVIVSIENFLMTAIWFWTDSFNRWWFSYLAILICFGSFMSFMSFLVYNLMLKPKTKIIYPTISKDCVFPVTMG